MNFQAWNKSHTAIVIAGFVTGLAVAFGSGAEAFLQAEPAATLAQAFTNMATLHSIEMGALSAGAMTAVAFLGAYLKSFHVDVPGGAGTGVAPVAAKAAVVIPVVPPGRDQRGEFRGLDMGRFLLRGAAPAAGLLFVVLAACTTAELQKASTVTNASGQVCEIVVQAIDPSLAPLCATAQAVANAILALGQQYVVASTPDAGASDAGPAVGLSAVVTNDSLYRYLAAHGTKTVLDK